jgi:hypothetical protein
MSHDQTWFGPLASSSGLTVGGWGPAGAALPAHPRRARSGTSSTPWPGRCPHPAAWRTRWPAPRRHGQVRGGPAGPPCAPPPTAPAAGTGLPGTGRAGAVGCGDGGGSGWPEVVPPPRTRCGGTHHRGQLGDGSVDHVVSPPLPGALSVASCSNSAESFPWTSMTLRAFASSAARRSFSRRSRAFSRSTGSAGGRPDGLASACSAPRSRCLRHS